MADAIRQPRSTEQAKALAERWAELDGQIAKIEANRTACIADVNQRCDTAVADLVIERSAICEKLEPWWAKAGATLTEGKRKSIELGGCMIGSRTGNASLAVAGVEKAIAGALAGLRWGKALTTATPKLDRKAIMAALMGKRKAELEELGLSRKEGEDVFFVERVVQGGTLGGQA